MTNESILHKIRSMLAKTVENGCTEAEAMAALGIAQRMMAEYEVTAEDLELEDEKAVIEYSHVKDVRNIRWKLCYWVARFTDTYSYGNKREINFVGLKSDVDFAIWLVETLARFVDAQLKSYLWANGYQSIKDPAIKRKIINGFVIGCTDRINRKLAEMVSKRPSTTNSTALVVAKDALIKEAIKDIKIGNSDNRGRPMKAYRNAVEAGSKAGENASFGRPVEGGLLRIGNK